MLYRNNPHLDAQFQKAVRAAHDQDWDAFERFSFYDADLPWSTTTTMATTLPSSESMSAVQGSPVPKTGATLYRKA